MDKLLNAVIEVSQEADCIKKHTAKISEMHDNFIKLKDDIETEQSARIELADQIRKISSNNLLKLLEQSTKTYTYVKYFVIMNCGILLLVIVVIFTGILEIKGMNIFQYLRGDLTYRQKVAIFEELTGESLENMETVKENLRNFRELDSCEQAIFMDYTFGHPVAVLEKINNPKTGEPSYKIIRFFKKRKSFLKDSY